MEWGALLGHHFIVKQLHNLPEKVSDKKKHHLREILNNDSINYMCVDLTG